MNNLHDTPDLKIYRNLITQQAKSSSSNLSDLEIEDQTRQSEKFSLLFEQ